MNENDNIQQQHADVATSEVAFNIAGQQTARLAYGGAGRGNQKKQTLSCIGQIRVQNLPKHENVQTSDTALHHVKRLERNSHTGVDDSNSNVTDGRVGLRKYRKRGVSAFPTYHKTWCN